MNKRNLNRMMKFDYSKNNVYFITICIKNNLCCLWSSESEPYQQVKKNKSATKPHQAIQLSKFGTIIKDQILKLEVKYSFFNIHNYVIMPNHIHLIIEMKTNKKQQNTNQKETILTIFKKLKYTCTKIIKATGFAKFGWRKNYHEYIISSFDDYLAISEYISDNPKKWEQDTFYTKS